MDLHDVTFTRSAPILDHAIAIVARRGRYPAQTPVAFYIASSAILQ
jgi:hypothetical protein